MNVFRVVRRVAKLALPSGLAIWYFRPIFTTEEGVGK